MRKFVRVVLLLLAGALLLGFGWLALTSDAKIAAVRNTLIYKAMQKLGGARVRTEEAPGSLSGGVLDSQKNPAAGAVVLLASPLGDTYSAETDPDGLFRLQGLPPGRYVPVAAKRGYVDALPRTCVGGLCVKHGVRIGSSGEAGPVTLTLAAAPTPTISIDESLVVSPTTLVETSAPFQGKARRTNLSFVRDGLKVHDCWLYEPAEGDGPFPTLLLVLPGPVLGWEIVPVPFADEGYSVLACYPLRGLDIDADGLDLLLALEYLRQGKLPGHADTNRLGLIAASFTSLHGYRLLGMTEQFDVALVLGGLADAFLFRHDVETGAAHAREPFDQALIALGFPHTSPEQYFKYSVRYHMAGLPPLCLLHGKDDELVPYNQSVILDEELTRRGMPHEFYSYEGLKHYFSTSADNATTQQMMQDSLDCLGRALGGL